MITITKRALFALLLGALSVTAARAQGTYTAASCSFTDVNDCINGSGANTCLAQGSSTGATHTAVDGDTINIPSGSCSWTSGITINVGISIIGAGAASTTITDNYTGGHLITWNIPSATSSLARLSSLTIAGGSSGSYAQPTLALITGTCNSSTCSNIRWDHITLSGWVPSTNFLNFMVYSNDVFGVFDHNTVTMPSGGEFWDVGHGSYGGVGSNGDNSWAQPDSYGSANALYFETNTITTTSTSSLGAITDTDYAGGARFVVRFNTLNNVYVPAHGTESTGRTRGIRQLEVYNNALNCTNDSSGCVLVGLRGGVNLTFDNTITVSGGAWMNEEVSPTLYRAYAVFTPWGTCDGTGQWDDNDGTTYASSTVSSASGGTVTASGSIGSANEWASSGGYPYSLHDATGSFGEEISSNTSTVITPLTAAICTWGSSTRCTWTPGDTMQVLRAKVCIDQPGRGGDGATYLSGTTPSPTGWVNEPLDPVYEWGDTESGGNPNFGWVYPNGTTRLLQDRDWYEQNSSFNGTSGTGTGTLANRPSTCTAGVAYWATDQGSWNTSGSGGQGELFICGSSGWPTTPSYVPYTYPHPLTGSGTPLSPPTNVQAVGH